MEGDGKGEEGGIVEVGGEAEGRHLEDRVDGEGPEEDDSAPRSVGSGSVRVRDCPDHRRGRGRVLGRGRAFGRVVAFSYVSVDGLCHGLFPLLHLLLNSSHEAVGIKGNLLDEEDQKVAEEDSHVGEGFIVGGLELR